MDHPIAFHKSTDLGKVPKKLAAAPIPDLEEAFDVCSISDPLVLLKKLTDDSQLDEPEDEKEDKKPKDPTGIADDKLLMVGGKSKAKTKSSVKGKGKGK